MKTAAKISLLLVLAVVLIPPASRLAGWALDAIGWWISFTGAHPQ